MDERQIISTFRSAAADRRRCFWLDGTAGRDWSGSRSYLGWLDHDDVSICYDARTGVVRRHQRGAADVVGSDVFDVLAQELRDGPPDAQWFGYFGYAARPDLPARPSDDLPDAVWMRPSHLRILEHPPAQSPTGGAGLTHGLAPGQEAAYREAFERVQEALRAGDSYEINLTYRAVLDLDADPATTYLALRTSNPAPYAGFLQHDLPGARAWLLSSSPERYATVRLTEDIGNEDGVGERWIESRPIKGTMPRGATPTDDAWLRERLAQDPRFRAENLMIVDLLRNDIGMVSDPGTVSTPSLMEVESFASVHQLVSTVRGRVRAEVSTMNVVRALFPPGSMTGAPKRRTMTIIQEVEDSPRGAYSGAFGRISAAGETDLGVIIRSLTTDGTGRWALGTGGGITVHSQVEQELAETRVKAARLLDVLAQSRGAARGVDSTNPMEVR